MRRAHESRETRAPTVCTAQSRLCTLAPAGILGSAVAVVVVAEDGHDHDERADDDGEVERAREEGRVE